jgi:uncharacterized protein YxjI
MSREDGIGAVDLTGETYTVKGSLVRDHYRVYDEDGELLLEADRREFRANRAFRFRDSDGEEAFSVQEGNIEDDFFVVPPEGDRPLVILERDSSLLGQEWNVRHGTTERLLATFEASGPMREFLRYYVPMMGVLPHTYVIEDADGNRIGTLSGQFTLSDSYELDVDTADGTDRESLVAAALSIDALEVS